MFWTLYYMFAFNFLVCLYLLTKGRAGLEEISGGYATSLCWANSGHNPDLYRHCMVFRHLTSFTQFCWTNDTQTGLLSCKSSFLNPHTSAVPFFFFLCVSFLFFNEKESALPTRTHSVQTVNFMFSRSGMWMQCLDRINRDRWRAFVIAVMKLWVQ